MDYTYQVILFTICFAVFMAFVFKKLGEIVNQDNLEVYMKEYINSLEHHIDHSSPEIENIMIDEEQLIFF